MITTATVTATGQLADPLEETAKLRGDPTYSIDATDLLEFGHSPLRWVKTPPAAEKGRPSILALLRCMWLAPGALAATYVRRPDTYNALTLTCPNCKSVSTAKVCRTCGLSRVNVGSVKDWTGSASYCTQWTAQQANAGRQVITGAQWDAADRMTRSLSADPCAQELRDQSTVLSLISGTWHDAATGLDIPVHCNLDFAPKSPGSLDMAIGSLTVTSDADPGTWTANAYNHGMHIRAALKQALHAAATTDTRSTHLWCICERDEPYLTARRRATPELMTRANDTLAQLMGTYALCLSTQFWPPFDPSAAGSLTAWSQVFLEPWMTQGDAGAAGYFALGAVPTPP